MEDVTSRSPASGTIAGVIVDCALYEHGVRRPGLLAIKDAPTSFADKESFVWLGLFEPTTEEFEEVSRHFGLHELAVEDALTAHQRPKLELYDESVFMVVKTARYLDAEETIEFGEILIFIGDGFIVHVRHGEATPLAGVRQRIEHRPELVACGPSAVLYSVVDAVVDSYEAVVAGLDNDIHEVELDVFSDKADDAAARIYFLKREVLELRDSLAPLLKPLHDLASSHIEFVHEETQEYFRDVYDHLARMVEEVGRSNDLLGSVLSANLTRVSVRQNEDMRKISAWAAILAVPTALAGIYGMNFTHMPELDWQWGYPLVIVTMGLICGGLYRAFKRTGWL
jgi:magnesium transporter